MVNFTATSVAFDDIPQMVENGWEAIIFSEARQKAVMIKREQAKIDQMTGLPGDLKPKLGTEDPHPPIDSGPIVVPVDPILVR